MDKQSRSESAIEALGHSLAAVKHAMALGKELATSDETRMLEAMRNNLEKLRARWEAQRKKWS
jgi:hypothetical protein